MFKHWMKHTAMVPKGFLRLYVLKLLSKKPMSGSEIMQEIENRSRGCWKPSPGSIYPLMSWLQEKDFIKGVPTEEAGMKRYTLTNQGKAFVEEHMKRREEMRKRFSFLGPPFFEFFWLDVDPKGAQELGEASQRLVKVMLDLRENLRKRHSQTAVNEAKIAIEKTVKKIDEINKKFAA